MKNITQFLHRYLPQLRNFASSRRKGEKPKETDTYFSHGLPHMMRTAYYQGQGPALANIYSQYFLLGMAPIASVPLKKTYTYFLKSSSLRSFSAITYIAAAYFIAKSIWMNWLGAKMSIHATNVGTYSCATADFQDTATKEQRERYQLNNLLREPINFFVDSNRVWTTALQSVFVLLFSASTLVTNAGVTITAWVLTATITLFGVGFHIGNTQQSTAQTKTKSDQNTLQSKAGFNNTSIQDYLKSNINTELIKSVTASTYTFMKDAMQPIYTLLILNTLGVQFPLSLNSPSLLKDPASISMLIGWTVELSKDASAGLRNIEKLSSAKAAWQQSITALQARSYSSSTNIYETLKKNAEQSSVYNLSQPDQHKQVAILAAIRSMQASLAANAFVTYLNRSHIISSTPSVLTAAITRFHSIPMLLTTLLLMVAAETQNPSSPFAFSKKGSPSTKNETTRETESQTRSCWNDSTELGLSTSLVLTFIVSSLWGLGINASILVFSVAMPILATSGYHLLTPSRARRHSIKEQVTEDPLVSDKLHQLPHLEKILQRPKKTRNFKPLRFPQLPILGMGG